MYPVQHLTLTDIKCFRSEEYNNDMESHEDLQSELSLIESKSRFTEYSMTSSVIRRNEKLVLLDDHFETVSIFFNF